MGANLIQAGATISVLTLTRKAIYPGENFITPIGLAPAHSPKAEAIPLGVLQLEKNTLL